MAKIDNKIIILPDIEMYGGNTDIWEVQLMKANGKPYTYDELDTLSYELKLVVTDYGYQYRPGGSAYTVFAIDGELGVDDDMSSAVARFQFEQSDTLSLHGKYLYQISMETNDTYVTAQGTLMIRGNISIPN